MAEKLEGLIKDLSGPHEFTVIPVSVSVAALIPQEMVDRVIEAHIDKKIDLFLIPGLIPWDATSLEGKHGTKVRKGPRNYRDIPRILEVLNQLSPKKTADSLLALNFEEELQREISTRFSDPALFSGYRNFKIFSKGRELGMGRDFPPVVMAQIVNAPKLSVERAVQYARYYVSQGAQIIDVGAYSKAVEVEKLKSVISTIREELKVPVAIDSMRDQEILAGIDAGASMVLSIDLGNLELAAQIPKDTIIVGIPTNQRKGIFDRSVTGRVENLLEVTTALIDQGFSRLLADPLLETPIQPGILPSIAAFHQLALDNRLEIPLMLGIENVTEMCDFDSPGMNGLLASIAVEAGAGCVLTTEFSIKTRGAVNELTRAIELAFFSRTKQAPPKDFPHDLLIAKSKIKGDEAPFANDEFIEPSMQELNYRPDQKGYFKIFVDHSRGEILAYHYTMEHALTTVVRGRDAESLGKTLIEKDLVGNKQHAVYLGRELDKAETALSYHKSYLQED